MLDRMSKEVSITMVLLAGNFARVAHFPDD